MTSPAGQGPSGLTVEQFFWLDIDGAWRGHILLAPHPDEGPLRFGGHGRAINVFSLNKEKCSTVSLPVP